MLVVRRQLVEPGAVDDGDAFDEIVRVGEGQFGRRPMAALHVEVQLLDQVVLGGEVVVGVTHRHARLLRDEAHGRRFVPALAKRGERHLAQPGTRALAFRGRGPFRSEHVRKISQRPA
jgi:hypothetical protein